MKNKSGRMFPLFIDLSEKSILVVGAGKIAQRRIQTLLEFGPERVTVIAPQGEAEIHRLAREEKIIWHQRNYRTNDLESYDMVLAVTDNKELNAAIGTACAEQGILVNVSSSRELCDFHFPGVVLKDEITVGINASGINHKKARQVRINIEDALEQE